MKIPSFRINHKKLNKGVYVSRKDELSPEVTVTTFDIRMKKPYEEPVMNTAEIHTIEHIGATYLRNCEIKDDVVYFGPMGCRTGFYLIVKGDLIVDDIAPYIRDCFEEVKKFKGDIPGASEEECGNCYDMNLPMAKLEAEKFLKDVLYNLNSNNTYYPED